MNESDRKENYVYLNPTIEWTNLEEEIKKAEARYSVGGESMNGGGSEA